MEFRYGILLFYALLITITYCQATRPLEEEPSERSKIYCGKHLSSALSIVCDGRYNTYNLLRPQNNSRHRRSLRDILFPSIAAGNEEHELKREKRGVWNECCEKPCTRKVLMSYCAAK